MKELKSNIQIIVAMTTINSVVLWNFISRGKTLHGIGYFVFFYISILIIYYLTKKLPPKNEIEVKEPKRELIIAIIFAVLGTVFLALNFMIKSNLISDKLYTKIPIGIGSLLFGTPIGIFIYLLFKRYKLMRLGLTTKPIYSIVIGLVIWGLTGLFAYLFYPEGMRWSRANQELGGIFGIILQGVIGAALFEEFSRFIIQSRFEKVFSTKGFNILFATGIWALMHAPVQFSKGNDLSGTCVYCIQIIPLGFIWGYLTQRTKSIVPATFAHGLNLWGLQNG